jgi:hypothetical protein
MGHNRLNWLTFVFCYGGGERGGGSFLVSRGGRERGLLKMEGRAAGIEKGKLDTKRRKEVEW